GGGLACTLPLARVGAEAFQLRGLRRGARRIGGIRDAAGECQCDRGREHRSCYGGSLHRVNLLSGFEIRRQAEGADFSRFIKRSGTSDLKITFAWLGTLLPGLGLHRLDLVVDLVQPMLKFRGLDLHADLASLADDMSFAVLFDIPHQQRVLEAALRTGNVYRFVFKHIETS